ncbi:hypothetical protein OAL67_00905 [bacterium]|nr:hypothetical protein [bacterium]
MKMYKLIHLIKDYFVPKKNSKINLDPNNLGLIVNDGKISISWDDIQELREDTWLGRLDFFNKWRMQDIVITTTNSYYSHKLSELVKKAIINNANLKPKKVSFWASQKVYAK